MEEIMKNGEIVELVKEKDIILEKINSLIYGSIEIRENDNKKYIYVHFRDGGIVITKYVGEYNDNTYNLILNNNTIANQLKKQLRIINKKLKELNYVDTQLDDKVMKNIDFARKHLAETIYKQAILEGVATTYADTENIIEGGKANNMTSEDIMKIVNLKHAWDFILNKDVITSKTDFNLLQEINKLIEEGFYYTAGQIRTVPVKIGGTEYIPPFPVKTVLEEDINNILNTRYSTIDIAIELLLYTTKRQIFIDGNKRSSVIFANHYLISHGKGIIVIPAKLVSEYKELLVNYYEGKDIGKIKKFLKEKCYLKI
jgi:fido (protein-threonine AMPylation protein)